MLAPLEALATEAELFAPLYLLRVSDAMTICARPGCTAAGKPKYCTRRCSAIDIAQTRDSSYYQSMAKRGMNAKRQRGHKVLRPSDVLLMAAGRYAEAARMLYDRGFQAGWQTGRKNQRQLPAREFAKAG